jgi:hypothetical protein
MIVLLDEFPHQLIFILRVLIPKLVLTAQASIAITRTPNLKPAT